jgi:hypothetical protein
MWRSRCSSLEIEISQLRSQQPTKSYLQFRNQTRETRAAASIRRQGSRGTQPTRFSTEVANLASAAALGSRHSSAASSRGNSRVNSRTGSRQNSRPQSKPSSRASSRPSSLPSSQKLSREITPLNSRGPSRSHSQGKLHQPSSRRISQPFDPSAYVREREVIEFSNNNHRFFYSGIIYVKIFI